MLGRVSFSFFLFFFRRLGRVSRLTLQLETQIFMVQNS